MAFGNKSHNGKKRCCNCSISLSYYGLGDPQSYLQMVLHLDRGDEVDQRTLCRLVELQYQRNEVEFKRSMYRVRGDVIDVFPADSEKEALRIELFGNEIDSLKLFDPLTGEVFRKFHVLPFIQNLITLHLEKVLQAIEFIKEELAQRLDFLRKETS